jgi:hypothetical protein
MMLGAWLEVLLTELSQSRHVRPFCIALILILNASWLVHGKLFATAWLLTTSVMFLSYALEWDERTD